jgi:hypothetical protein
VIVSPVSRAPRPGRARWSVQHGGAVGVAANASGSRVLVGRAPMYVTIKALADHGIVGDHLIEEW